ncbi:MAG: hypothetical protein ABSD98_19615, partial [Candidatus Korobacteraceae bacterium]
MTQRRIFSEAQELYTDFAVSAAGAVLRAEGWFPENVISQQWLGGEIRHAWFAARGRMLEYSLELGQKIAEVGRSAPSAILFMRYAG